MTSSISEQSKKKLIHKFQPPDERDRIYKVINNVTGNNNNNNNNKLSLSTYMVPNLNLANVLDQGDLGDCVSNALAFTISTMTKSRLNISRLMHYTITRCISGDSITDDNGLYIRDACKSISSNGVSLETVWPYIPNNYFTFPSIYTLKCNNLFVNYSYTFVKNDLNSLKNCLLVNNVPIIFGFYIYSTFLSSAVTNTGIVPIPNTKTETYQGGHCACIVGFNDTTQCFTCVNSWGTSWGNKGLFYMPYNYVTNSKLCSDFCFLYFKY
jgi:C1A family cysteine protease